MGFSQSTITSISQPVYSGALVYLSWTSTSPAGTWYQVYLDQSLAWWGQSTSTRLTVPIVSPVRIDIGTVDAGEEQTNFASSLPAAAANFAELNWIGGTFESAELAGFYVYRSLIPGGPVLLVSPITTITAYPGGFTMDGFGLGGFGLGGFGYASSAYQYIDGPLASGLWQYSVVPFDDAGNSGTPQTTSVTICCPPPVPGLFSDGTRLHYVYSQSLDTVTLNWNAG